MFDQARKCLEACSKQLKKEGKGKKPNAAEAFTDVEENILYEKNLLGISNAEALLNSVAFQFGAFWLERPRRTGLMDIPILKRLIVDRTPREISSIKCFVVNVQVSNGQWSSNKYTSCFSSFRVYLLYSEATKITGS